jgi:hypothetical protein
MEDFVVVKGGLRCREIRAAVAISLQRVGLFRKFPEQALLWVATCPAMLTERLTVLGMLRVQQVAAVIPMRRGGGKSASESARRRRKLKRSARGRRRRSTRRSGAESRAPAAAAPLILIDLGSIPGFSTGCSFVRLRVSGFGNTGFQSQGAVLLVSDYQALDTLGFNTGRQ